MMRNISQMTVMRLLPYSNPPPPNNITMMKMSLPLHLSLSEQVRGKKSQSCPLALFLKRQGNTLKEKKYGILSSILAGFFK